MVTMAQRIEALRTEAGLARVPASLELGFPKNAFEKFETGRQTPNQEQQEKRKYTPHCAASSPDTRPMRAPWTPLWFPIFRWLQ